MKHNNCIGCIHYVAPSLCLAENAYDLRDCKQNEIDKPPSVVNTQKILPQEGLNNVIRRTASSSGQNPRLRK